MGYVKKKTFCLLYNKNLITFVKMNLSINRISKFEIYGNNPKRSRSNN